MPLGPGVRYRVVRRNGKKVRLAFRGGSAKAKTGTIVEAKSLETDATHTPEEFAADRRRKKQKRHRAFLGG